ncbi:NAD-glutamate dehydrogenase [Solimonas marina]|uniref:NAD-glutamate dehydrogenase n=1 Tax=Solimonas marina TaxID=2714601 RepID=A0A970BAP2_9GAMM|nr:NAD-glutamate dehydrogenase [Solimonas marina]NKF24669.1 NAD-glutamate dehydrogenase [Solimonas marina]
MRSEAVEQQTQLLDRLQALARERAPQDQCEAFVAFIRPYYEMASLDTLRMRTVDELVDAALRHFLFAQRRAPGEMLVRVLPPADFAMRGSRGLARLETVVDDMPFLVDSLSMAIRDTAAPIDWLVHPILHVARRNEQWDELADDGESESLIHVEFEAFAQASGYTELERHAQALLGDLRCIVDDFSAMRTKAIELAGHLAAIAPGVSTDDGVEAGEFLRWLESGHFTFLGCIETDVVVGDDGRARFEARPERALGLARPGRRYADADALIAPREELDKYSESSRLIVITKGNQRSHIHHAEFVDVVSVKRLRADGSNGGTCRFIGLFSADAYIDRPRSIPLMRRKAEQVMRRSRLPELSHSGKYLREILYQLPRDELFQSNEEELFEACMGIRALRERAQLKLLMRRDRYGRFFSCMVFIPRERYSRELRDRIGTELMDACGGIGMDRNMDFLRHGMARIHYTVRTPPGTVLAQTPLQIEQRLLTATRSWRDQLRDVYTKRHRQDALSATRFLDAFPPSYQELTSADEAAADLFCLLHMPAGHDVVPRLIVESEHGAAAVPTALKLYCRGQPVALSDVLPTLENFGLRVLSQDPHELHAKDGEVLWIQQFTVQLNGEPALPPDQQRAYFEAAFVQAGRGQIENDGLNRLVLLAGLDARQVVCLRVLTKYLIQTGLPYSQDYQERLLAEYAPVARLLVQLFEARFDPKLSDEQRRDQEIALGQGLDAALDAVATLDGDRVLRAYTAVVRAALRTNYFQKAADGARKSYVSIKLDPRGVPELPAPLPMFEIFVYAPQVEGIHLRGGRVARGGLRWSDRKQDFRTEVLGLMKAQMVKNAIIVPVGAKGGFVVKQGDPTDREAWMKLGVECYKTFLRGLLDITDNNSGDGIVPPLDVVRHDEDDPYLVVAADKGTATFSDIANGLAAEYGFWLGDAFASGGSAGYDHKKMGITARGAWESVKRHFRELGRDIQSEPFTAVGVGDMSGDVFGNGMLLSPQTQLVAAFDHRHIFIDPQPDVARSFAERERLFALPRSSWDDYDRTCLSEGGGIWPRSAKLITLSDAAQRVLGVTRRQVTPQELMRAILLAPVDLLWNGGIGTYVKSHLQSHEECGDRANDAIRVDGRQLRCKVVGEGGNLGCTQLGRIEYALSGGDGAGGRINSDFIDNAAGVHTSDREVNIKIPLNRMLQAGALTREVRDPLLARMTDRIAESVLDDNYVQSLAISLIERSAADHLGEHAELMRTLERDGQLNRGVEFLPDDDVLKERRAKGRGLTRPELAVLLSYSKISLFDGVLQSDVPDEPFFDRDLLDYFPSQLVEGYREHLLDHRLRREIIATILANAVVNRMGFAFAHRFAEDHGVPRADVVKAYAIAHEIYDGDRYWLPIQALDTQVPSALQLRLFGRAIGLMKHATTWLLNYQWTAKPVHEAVSTFRDGVATLTASFPGALPGTYRADWDRAVAAMQDEGVPEPLARQLANTMVAGSALDIVEIASAAAQPLTEAAAVYFEVGDRLGILWLLSTIIAYPAQSKWQALARANLREDSYRLHRKIAARVLKMPGETAAARFEAWLQASPEQLKFGLQRFKDLRAGETPDFMMLAVAVRELRKLGSL